MSRDKINKDAWDILKEDEKTAISLSLGHGKSTWESGEIMNKAHFKYLEIQKRARKFLEIFTQHFEKYGGLFPEDIPFTFAFKEYIGLVVLQRYNISQAVKIMEDPSYRIAKKRSQALIFEIERLKKNNIQEAIDFYGLIMDFDRWNNHRILPSEVQEPSAFKRRNKSRDIKHLKRTTSLPQFSLLKIMERFRYTGKYPKLYTPLISTFFPEKYKIISVKNKSSIVTELSDIGLFIFEEPSKAGQFAKLVAKYFLVGERTCKTGQKFWPEFRLMMREAFNHAELENIHKSRKYLDNALFNTDLRKIKKSREKLPKHSPDSAFY